MNDNEDYLERLLQQASVINNPDSALSRGVDLTQKERELNNETEHSLQNDDNAVSEIEKFNLNDEELSSSFSDADNSLEESELNDIDINSLLDGISDINSDLSESVELEVPDLGEIEDTLANLEENFEDLTDKTAETDDVPIEDLLFSEDNKFLSEDNNLLSEDNNMLSEEILDEKNEPAETLETPEEELDDIEKLLNSGFSGEIEMPEMPEITEEGEIPAVSEVSDESEVFENSEEVTDIKDNTAEDEVTDSGVLSDDAIEKLISQMNSEENSGETDEDQLNIDGLDSLEDVDFSESDIENLIDKASDVEDSQPAEELEIDLEDLAAFESEFGIYDKNAGETATDDALDEVDIGSLFDDDEKSDDDADIMSLLNDAVQKSEEEEASEEAEQETAKGKKTKDKKKKKEKKAKEKEEKPKKEKGKLGKFFEFLTKEDEPEENNLLGGDDSGDSLENGTGENKDINDAVDKEEDTKDKKKKKKDKKKKGKKGEKESNPDEESEGDESEDKKKAKKPKKEKKERKPLELDIDTGKPLSKRNVILIFVLCLSIMGAIILVVNLIPPMISNQKARDAFFREEYETTYQTFYGEKLNEADQAMFDKAEIVLKLQHKYDAYAAYINMNMRVEALDQLLQAVSKYDTWVIAAEANNFRDPFDKVYNKILTALSGEFGLSLSDAKEIILLPSDLEYSLKCYAIATGTEYIDPTLPMPSEFVPESLTPDSVEIKLEDKLNEEGN